MKNKYLILLVLVCLPFLGTVNAWVGGSFTVPESSGLENCRVNTEISQPEDIVYSKKLGGIIVSSSQMSHYKANNKPGLYLIKDSGEVSLLYQPEDYTFLPQGLGLYEANDEAYLFVVNHHPQGDEVIRLSWFLDSSKPWIDYFKLGKYKNARDVAAYDKDKFIVTHEKSFITDKFKSLASLFRLRSGYLTLYDGEKLKKLSPNIQSPMGIAVDATKGLAYVAGFLGKRIKVYEFSEKGFFRKSTFLLPEHPYYFSLEKEELLVATHPNIFTLQKFSQGKEAVSSWGLFEVNLQSGKSEKIMSGDGIKISALGSVIKVSDKLYGTGLFQKKLLICSE